jgi:ubiquitin C-terminal hydrolase
MIQELVKEMKRRKRVEMFGNFQESASEGLTLLLDMMNSPAIYDLFYHRYEFRIICNGCGDVVSRVNDFEIHFEFFLEDGAAYPKTAGDFSDYIRKHTSTIDEYTCEKCNTKAKDVIRGHNLKMLPEIFIILFNKYKKKDLIWYPTEMEFPGKHGTSMHYKLVGKVEHYGSLNGGHYTAVGLRNSGYYEFNDSNINAVTDIGPTPNTYLIAYHRVFKSAPFVP